MTHNQRDPEDWGEVVSECWELLAWRNGVLPLDELIKLLESLRQAPDVRVIAEFDEFRVSAARRLPKPKPAKTIPPRSKRAFELRAAGASLDEVSAELGVSRERARQLVVTYKLRSGIMETRSSLISDTERAAFAAISDP